jgi:hypothetical protein
MPALNRGALRFTAQSLRHVGNRRTLYAIQQDKNNSMQIANDDTATRARIFAKAKLENLGLRVEEKAASRRKMLVVYGTHGNSITVLVRGKTSGTWQGSIDDPKYSPTPRAEFYWVLVDLEPSQPECYVCPGSFLAADVARAHARYLEHHGGVRAEAPDSKHHAIRPYRVEGWKDVWQPLLHQANLPLHLAETW